MISFNYLRNAKFPSEKIHVAISGANGALGQALLRHFYHAGACVIGLTTSSNIKLLDSSNNVIPIKWIVWKCGEEQKLAPLLQEIDLLIINHGVNNYQKSCSDTVNTFININAISPLRLLNLGIKQLDYYQEIWINTSEAEIQPAFSPLYEISKRLIGQLTSFHRYSIYTSQGLRIRKLILGPFKSTLNPIGIMTPDFVAGQIIYQAQMGIGLIIVTPNPLTYILAPIVEFIRWLYCKCLTERLRI
uniref:Short chain dehydrogenase n=1 Tax=Paulinella micropora TaxID=1928728 RepID=A0A385HZB3_9EUKA|nr:short chain dehydrogenase [Paulinella micropora]AXY62985.1 short chain dehydrogenase [Paulinella micropora]